MKVPLTRAGPIKRLGLDDRIDFVGVPLPPLERLSVISAEPSASARLCSEIRAGSARQRFPLILVRFKIREIETKLRTFNRHLDDAELSFEERSQLDLGAELLHLHFWRCRVAYADIGEAHNRGGQQAQVGLAGNRDRPADLDRSLALETLRDKTSSR